MSDILTSTDVAFAINAVREASLLVRRVQREMVGKGLSKEDKSPVTVADFAAQAMVAYRLAETFPAATLIGEESAAALEAADERGTLDQIVRFVQTLVPDATADAVCQWIDRGAGEAPAIYWTLDPVDGTKGFLRNDQYAVALALIEDGEVTIGVLGCPELENASTPVSGGAGSIIAAVRGEGCWTQPLSGAVDHWTRLRVASTSDVRQSRLLRSVEKGHTDVGGIDGLIQNLGITADAVPMDSQAKYAVLAAGGGDVLLRLLSPSRPDYREKVWDQAAGSIVVEEAGGQVSDLDGRRLDFSHGRTLEANRGVLATNGRLHDSVLTGLRSVKA